jgi:hypothetical protein
MSSPVQDVITFNLSADTIVTNNTVKVTASISGIITTDSTDIKLKEKLTTMMNKFIPGAIWQFSNMTRTSHASGMEELSLNAITRINETENYSLDRRSREASNDGMRITNINVDTTPPTTMVENAENDLRLIILDKAESQRKIINERLGRNYRLGSIIFQSAVDTSFSNRQGSKVMASATMSYGSGFNEIDNDVVGNAVKLTMNAGISLNIIVTE